MPFTKFTNLDFDQIKTSIKDYLRANSTFTDFDFEGSNFSVLIDTLAYNTYITAFNSNMIVNESFLDSATLRENVVSLARVIGYVPASRRAAKATISFTAETTSTSPNLTLKAGLVCTGSITETTYIFSVPEDQTRPIVDGMATFNNIDVYEGTYLTKQFTVNGSLDQKFILDNPYIDTSTIIVHVKGVGDSGLGIKYSLVDNILKVNKYSQIYLIQEIQDEKYQLIFGDGIFGTKLQNGSIITVSYVVTSGISGNNAKVFSFAGNFSGSLGEIIVPTNKIDVTTNMSSMGGGEAEPLDSIKYFAPKAYSAQHRAVTARDYETIIPTIYPNTESVSIVGGEELDPPQYGVVQLSIKPKNGFFVSDFDKTRIITQLKQYSLSGIRQTIVDLKILYVEIDSNVYYNDSQVSSPEYLLKKVNSSLTLYSNSSDLNKFGGRFKYSKVLQVIDNTDNAVTSNITKVRIRRNLAAAVGKLAQYELCFGNKFHINASGYNIKSTGFRIDGIADTLYLTDIPNKNSMGDLDGSGLGVISIVKAGNAAGEINVIVKSAGTVNYTKGEIKLSPVNISSTNLENNIVEVQAYPESNDVVGLKDLYLYFDISKSKINMIKDVITSGEDISGVQFTRDYFTSSYSNGTLKRI
jgi:hypothetical protein